MSHNKQCLKLTGLTAKELEALFWAALQSVDPALPELPAKGMGHCEGDRLHLKWAHDASEGFLAVDVLDCESHEAWEAGFANIDGRTMGYWRRSWGAASEPPAPWLRATQSCRSEPHTPAKEPRFIALAGALASSSPQVIIEDAATIAGLEEDLAYWRSLANSQAKLLKKQDARPGLPALDALAATAHASQPAHVAQGPARKWKLSEIEEWAALNHHRITILPRALSECKRALYEDADRLYQALELLAETYPLVKLGELQRTILLTRAQEIGVTIGGSVDRSVAGESGDEYFIRWRGQRRFLDQHLGRGGSRDPRFTLRIYYTWDEETSCVVVGWLPTHLSTSGS